MSYSYNVIFAVYFKEDERERWLDRREMAVKRQGMDGPADNCTFDLWVVFFSAFEANKIVKSVEKCTRIWDNRRQRVSLGKMDCWYRENRMLQYIIIGVLNN